ncbi:MAG: PqqD family protein [Deltaproteobacteria bacterium]
MKENNFVTREIAGETIVVPIRGRTEDLDSIFTLNELGTMIWNLIDGRTNVSQIVESISKTYDVTEDEAAKDTFDFLTSLEAAELIH